MGNATQSVVRTNNLTFYTFFDLIIFGTMNRLPMTLVIANAIKGINLQPVKKMEFNFDPFHPAVGSIRQFMFAVSGKKIKSTNPNCLLQPCISSDRSAPNVKVHFENGATLFMKTEHLNLLQLVQNLSSLCEQYAVAPQVVETSTSGKIGKVKAKGKGKG